MVRIRRIDRFAHVDAIYSSPVGLYLRYRVKNEVPACVYPCLVDNREIKFDGDFGISY